MVWNTECSPERGPEWAGMRLRRVWLESAQEHPWKPEVLRPGSALLARERGLSGRALLVCCIEVCIGIVYWSCVRPGFACPDPSCVCGERYQPSCVCDGAVCADVRCVWSSTVFGRIKAGWQRWVVSIVGNVRSFHVSLILPLCIQWLMNYRSTQVPISLGLIMHCNGLMHISTKHRKGPIHTRTAIMFHSITLLKLISTRGRICHTRI